MHAIPRLFVFAALFASLAATAGEADVVGAKVVRAADGSYNFDVTIRSNDKGWDYYADRFEVLTPDGKVLGIRELAHPHETEQPFTRELYGVKIPQATGKVTIRARHRPKGYDGSVFTLSLPE